jgi:parvulin-like peptidyl-prolyl isomerase
MERTSTRALVALILLLSFTACAPAVTTPEAATPAPDADPTLVASPEVTATPPPPSEPASTPTPTPSPTPDAPLAALVNGQPLYLADYERALGQYEADLLARGVDPNGSDGQAEMEQARPWVLNVMIEQILTEQAAAEAGIVVSDADVDAYMQDLVDETGGEEAFLAKLAERGETYESAWQEVRAGLIGMAMTQMISEQVPEAAEHVHARHILVDTPEEAESILAQLERGADFATLAKAYSQDTSTKESGGDLGFFPRGILMAPEVEEAAFGLEPGQFSDVVTSSLGYHIVQAIERDPARQLIPENLRFLQDRAVQEWIEGLWAQALVQRFVETGP